MRISNHKISTYTISIICGFVLFVSVNLMAGIFLKSFRADLTEDKIFTLSESTYDVINKIEEPILLRLYFSEELGLVIPELSNYYKRVSELIEFYVNVSGGKIGLEYVSPEPFSDEEERALQSGIVSVPLGDGNVQGFFGLIVSNHSGDKTEVIPFFDPRKEKFLEYDFTKAINSVLKKKKKKIGVISYLPVMGKTNASPIIKKNPLQKWAVIKTLESNFDVVSLRQVASHIPSSIDVLVVFNPSSMDKRTIYAIDQYVLRGGKLLMFVDPFSEIKAKMHGIRVASRPGLKELFDAWHVSFDDTKVLSDIDLGMDVGSIAGEDKSTGQRNIMTKNPLWLRVKSENINHEHPITKGIENIVMATAGAFEVEPKKGVIFTPLMHSSKHSMMANVKRLEIGINHESFLRNFTSDDKEKIIAVYLSGFPNSIYLRAPKGHEGHHIMKAKRSINVVLAADSDMIHDGLSVQRQVLFGKTHEVPITDNLQFIVNSIDYLLGDEELINLRGKGSLKRSLHVLKEIKNKYDRKIRVEEQNILEKLSDNQYRLAELLVKSARDEKELSEEDMQEMVKLDNEIKEGKRHMAKMQYESRAGISAIYSKISFINIIIAPFLLFVLGIYVAICRFKRRRTYYKELEEQKRKQ